MLALAVRLTHSEDVALTRPQVMPVLYPTTISESRSLAWEERTKYGHTQTDGADHSEDVQITLAVSKWRSVTCQTSDGRELA